MNWTISFICSQETPSGMEGWDWKSTKKLPHIPPDCTARKRPKSTLSFAQYNEILELSKGINTQKALCWQYVVNGINRDLWNFEYKLVLTDQPVLRKQWKWKKSCWHFSLFTLFELTFWWQWASWKCILSMKDKKVPRTNDILVRYWNVQRIFDCR